MFLLIDKERQLIESIKCKVSVPTPGYFSNTYFHYLFGLESHQRLKVKSTAKCLFAMM